MSFRSTGMIQTLEAAWFILQLLAGRCVTGRQR